LEEDFKDPKNKKEKEKEKDLTIKK